MVYAFVQSKDSESALIKFKRALDNIELIPFDFEFIKPYEEVEWENEKDEVRFINLFNKSSKCKDVIFDDFYMYKQID